jgi:GxxExxY protein
MTFEPIPDEDERIAHAIIGAAIEVHRILGPGFLESIYRKALRYELSPRGFSSDEELPLFVQFKDLRIDSQRVDLLVERRVILELKCTDKFAPIHEALFDVLSQVDEASLRIVAQFQSSYSQRRWNKAGSLIILLCDHRVLRGSLKWLLLKQPLMA